MAKVRAAIIFLNGTPVAAERLKPYLRSKPLLIGCDGGTRQLIALGLTPDAIIGDFDSWPDDDLEGVTAVRYPVDKDHTDGELAIQYARMAGCQEIILVGALGGRLDHLLGHLLLLNKREFRALSLKIIDDTQEAFLIRKTAQVQGKKGDIVSFMPLNGPVKVVSCRGLRYPLSNYRLSPQANMGISNVMTAQSAEIVLSHGTLLVIHQL